MAPVATRLISGTRARPRPLLGRPGALRVLSWCARPTVCLAAHAQAARPRLELPKRGRCEAIQPPARHDCGGSLSAGPRSPRARASAPGPASGNRRMQRAAGQLAPRPGAAEPRALLIWRGPGPGAQPSADPAECHALPRRGDSHHLLLSLVGAPVLWHGSR